MKKIVVASTNPAKINAALDAFIRMFPDEEFTVEGVSVASGVSDQPTNDSETYTGAATRAQNAQTAAPNADYWVGLEGGIEAKGDEMESYAWMVVRAQDGRVGKGKTGTFFLPPAVAKLVHEGKELGDADDIVFGKTNSKQANGAVGLLTGDVLTRTSFYSDAIVLALVVFKNPEYYTQ